ncbi:hypothetical protein L208DRAFT_908668 [Tricholoma matsutake]|nr:hypothetical protein L208DRAFT_908668 [Tricholoma matsutake 945]
MFPIPHAQLYRGPPASIEPSEAPPGQENRVVRPVQPHPMMAQTKRRSRRHYCSLSTTSCQIRRRSLQDVLPAQQTKRLSNQSWQAKEMKVSVGGNPLLKLSNINIRNSTAAPVAPPASLHSASTQLVAGDLKNLTFPTDREITTAGMEQS